MNLSFPKNPFYDQLGGGGTGVCGVFGATGGGGDEVTPGGGDCTEGGAGVPDVAPWTPPARV